jgi:hypothetical protein
VSTNASASATIEQVLEQLRASPMLVLPGSAPELVRLFVAVLGLSSQLRLTHPEHALAPFYRDSEACLIPR